MSLNEGFELDDEGPSPTQVQEPTATSTGDDMMPFDFSGEMHEMAAAQSNAQDLTYLRNDIAGSGGMNKTFALEAERLMPGFLSNDRPIAYFTELPTKTQLTVSLESIREAIENTTAQLWEILCKMVERAIQFIKDVIKGYQERKNEEDRRLIERIVRNQGDVGSALQKVAKMVERPEHVATLVLEKLPNRSDKAAAQEKLRRRLIERLKAYQERDKNLTTDWTRTQSRHVWMRYFFAGKHPKVDFGQAIQTGEDLFAYLNAAHHKLIGLANDEAHSGHRDGRLTVQFKMDFESSYESKERAGLGGQTVKESTEAIRGFEHSISVEEFYARSVQVVQQLAHQRMLDQDLRAYEGLIGALEIVLKTLRESQSTSRQFKWNNEYGEVLRLMQRKTKEIMSFVDLYTGMSWAYRQLAKSIATHLEWAEEIRTLLRTSGFSESEIDQAKTLLGLSEIANVHRLLTDR